jgi:hypothetical protein
VGGLILKFATFAIILFLLEDVFCGENLFCWLVSNLLIRNALAFQTLFVKGFRNGVSGPWRSQIGIWERDEIGIWERDEKEILDLA